MVLSALKSNLLIVVTSLLSSLCLTFDMHAQASSQRLDFTYKGYAAGLVGAKLTGSIGLKSQTYRVRFSARSSGLGSLVKWRADVQGSGFADLAGIRPQQFAYSRTRRGKSSKRAISYSQGIANAIFVPNANIPPNEVISSDQTFNTADPVAAFMMVMNQVARQGSCRMRLKVFDGKSLYWFYVRDLGRYNYSDSRSAYKGPTHKCRILTKAIAGKATRPENLRKQAPIEFHVARPKAQGPAVPVAMSGNFQGIGFSLILSDFQ